jgi:hypothetical protein
MVMRAADGEELLVQFLNGWQELPFALREPYTLS